MIKIFNNVSAVFSLPNKLRIRKFAEKKHTTNFKTNIFHIQKYAKYWQKNVCSLIKKKLGKEMSSKRLLNYNLDDVK
jgi:hypothetical protein